MRRPDPIALQRLEALSAAVPPARPPEIGWPAEPWDLDAWPDVPPSLDAWPVRRLADPPGAAPAALPPAALGPSTLERAAPASAGTAPAGLDPAGRAPAAVRPAAGDAAASSPDRAASDLPDAAASGAVAGSPPGWAPPPGLAEHARAALLARLPAPLRAGRFDPGRRGAYVVGALGLLAAVAAIAFAVHGRAEAVAPVASSATVPAAAASGAAASGSDPISGGVTVEVDVEGRVRRPGLVTLPSGARVADALHSAGGALPGTNTRALDLAAPVTDGQQLVVGLAAAPAATGAAPAAGTSGTAGTSAGTTATGATALIDLNSATAVQLDALPHIGPVTAAKIVAWRTAHGPFAAVTDLQQVPGIGPSTYQDIAPLVTV